MRLASLLLGATAVLLASINATASIADTKAISQRKVGQNDNQAKRFLRTGQGNKLDIDDDAEERGMEKYGNLVIKLKDTGRMNTRLVNSAKLAAEKSGVKLTSADHLNTRLTKSAKLSAEKKSGVKLTDIDHLNTRLTRSDDLQKLRYAIKLRKRLKTPLTGKLKKRAT
ncbi:hypothetical protein ON010_g10385 [Phytophthora cinnamomi]|nr:hypothetical protein ON010_g10385 [Phytophthora cinnamomi]